MPLYYTSFCFEHVIFCSSVADIELFCRTTFGVQDSLNSVAPVPYREVQLPPKLRFGYYTSGASVS
jgi:amidase